MKKEPDKLSRDAAAAKAANMSYGKWMAMQEPPKELIKETPGGWRVCEYCGNAFKPKTKRPQKYCDVFCANRASSERMNEKLKIRRNTPVQEGARFGRLTVVARDEINDTDRLHWLCRCDCGNAVSVRTYSLTHGKKASCGCLRKEGFHAKNREDSITLP